MPCGPRVRRQGALLSPGLKAEYYQTALSSSLAACRTNSRHLSCSGLAHTRPGHMQDDGEPGSGRMGERRSPLAACPPLPGTGRSWGTGCIRLRRTTPCTASPGTLVSQPGCDRPSGHAVLRLALSRSAAGAVGNSQRACGPSTPKTIDFPGWSRLQRFESRAQPH